VPRAASADWLVEAAVIWFGSLVGTRAGGRRTARASSCLRRAPERARVGAVPPDQLVAVPYRPDQLVAVPYRPDQPLLAPCARTKSLTA
ncbi:MAG: hypothetical protein M0013_07415, partial [Actinomycetota bacterium]|nr:hypothetical protein [Actinomycetota bacterium]